jgi:hypothetical protein
VYEKTCVMLVFDGYSYYSNEASNEHVHLDNNRLSRKLKGSMTYIYACCHVHVLIIQLILIFCHHSVFVVLTD